MKREYQLQYYSLPSSENKQLFCDISKKLSDQYVEKEEMFLEQCCGEIMKLHDADHQSKAVWRAINTITGKTISKGIISAESDAERENLWYNHFNNLLSPPPSTDNISDDEDLPTGIHKEFKNCNFRTDIIDMDELVEAAKSLALDKACGLDEVVTQILKLTEIHILLLNLLNEIYLSKKPPAEWLVSILVPVHKKGSVSDTNNYRGLALMSVTAKLYNRILLVRIRQGLDTNLRYHQNGFRSERATSQHVLAARRIFEEIKDSSEGKLVAIFIDFSKAFDSVKWTWIRAVLLHYNVPEELVAAVMSMYNGAQAKVRYNNDQFTNYIDLSIGVLQGDTLAPYLFVIVLDYVMREALSDQTLGLKIANRVGTKSRPTCLEKYITDLDFADDIMLISDDAGNAQKQLNSVDVMARRVGLKINRAKTEFMMVGNWSSSLELRVSTGTINQVNDFKYLGSWLLDCTKDFEIRKALAWKACTRLVKVWKSPSISNAVKIKLFRACVESTLLYNAVTWTLTDTLSRKLDGCYTKLLRYALNFKWSDYVTNNVLYNGLESVSIRLLEKQLHFAGHCIRSKQPISELLLWDHTKLVRCKCSKGASNANYSRQLLKAIGKVDGLVSSDVEVGKLMLDREAWKSRISMIVKANKSSHSGRCKTRSDDIVV